MVEQKDVTPRASTFILSQEHPEVELARQLRNAGGDLSLLTDKQGRVAILIGPQTLDAYHNMRQELQNIILSSNSSNRKISPEFILGAVDQVIKNSTD